MRDHTIRDSLTADNVSHNMNLTVDDGSKQSVQLKKQVSFGQIQSNQISQEGSRLSKNIRTSQHMNAEINRSAEHK